MRKFYITLLAAILSLCGTAKATADEAHPWAGTYTLMKASEGLNYEDSVAASYGFEFVDQFRITVEWCDTVYKVTEFLNYDLKSLPSGGLDFNVEDDKYATIPTNRNVIKILDHFDEYIGVDEETGKPDTIPAYDLTLGLWGVDGVSNTPITVTRQSDGQIAINGFGIIWHSAYGMSFVCYYDKCVPLNGGDVEEVYDWTGFYKVDAGDFGVFNMGDIQWPSTFIMEIAQDDFGCYLNQFVGYEVGAPNFNSIYVDPNPKSGTEGQITIMDGFNLIATIDGTRYYLRDSYSEVGPIKLSYNKKDDTVKIDYFNIVAADGSESAYYLGCTATKISAEDAASIGGVSVSRPSAPSAVYNLGGLRLPSSAFQRINVVNGKKYMTR